VRGRVEDGGVYAATAMLLQVYQLSIEREIHSMNYNNYKTIEWDARGEIISPQPPTQSAF